jgi:hypothetical protein
LRKKEQRTHSRISYLKDVLFLWRIRTPEGCSAVESQYVLIPCSQTKKENEKRKREKQ